MAFEGFRAQVNVFVGIPFAVFGSSRAGRLEARADVLSNIADDNELRRRDAKILGIRRRMV